MIMNCYYQMAMTGYRQGYGYQVCHGQQQQQGFYYGQQQQQQQQGFHYGQQQQQQQQHQQRMQRKCTICEKIDGNQKIMHTHKVSECPFLKTNVCTICLEFGHMPSHCKNQPIPPVRTPAFLLNTEDSNNERDGEIVCMLCMESDETCIDCGVKYLEDMEKHVQKEKEKIRELCQYQDILEKRSCRMAIINGFYQGLCGFCKNSKEYNPNNIWQNNHTIKNCPKLALTVCRSCGGKGHTDRYCKVSEDLNSMIEHIDLDIEREQLIVDFDMV